MFIDRAIKGKFLKTLIPNKVLILTGARRTGKSMFIKHLLQTEIKEPYLLLNGEDFSTTDLLQIRTVENYKNLLAECKLLVIDEAQKIEDIGVKLKLMVDNIEGLKIIATGSSAFDLSNRLGEPLTGRKFTFNLYPIAQMEFTQTESRFETNARLYNRLVFGSYPELINYPGNIEKAEYLKEIVNSYLLKDILELERVKNSSKFINLLRLLAYQIGNEVSIPELGRQLGLSRNTVERYLDLLTKVYVIYQLEGFSRNLRNEITKSSKWYFYDNGIRNALISNFNDFSTRGDQGQLWENYILSERIKYQNYIPIFANNYFWRTYQQQEIDWIEEREGKLFAYEVKYNASKKVSVPSTFKNAYPESSFETITPANYLGWIE